jgi:hypothetical protein
VARLRQALITNRRACRPLRADAIRSTTGATIKYWVKQPLQSLKIDIVDTKGTVVDSFDGTPGGAGRTGGGGAGGGRGQGRGGGRGGFGGASMASMGAGLNAITWDMRYPDATRFDNMILWGGGVTGPAAPPGTYQVRLTANGQTQMQPLVVKRHPLYEATDADLQAQFDLAIQIRDKTSEANNAVIRIRSIKDQVADRLSKSQDARLRAAGERLTKNLSDVEGEIYQVKNESGQDPLNFPIKLNNRLASLLSSVSRGDGKPIGNAEPIFNDLKAELKVLTDKLEETLVGDLATFNTEAKRLGLPIVNDK